MQNKSPLAYQRHKALKGTRTAPVNDRAMTAVPRYGKKSVLTHRQGEKRMEVWLKRV